MTVHLNPETGLSAACKAQTAERCPYGRKGWEHFESEEQMQEILEARFEKIESISMSAGQEIPDLVYETPMETVERVNNTVTEINNFANSVERGHSPDEILSNFRTLQERYNSTVRGVNSHIADFGDPIMNRIGNMPGFQFSSYYKPTNEHWNKQPDQVELAAHEISAVSLGMTSIDEAKEEINKRISPELDEIEANKILREIYKEQVEKSKESDKKLIFLDIETTGMNPMEGEIIEYGYTVTDVKGNILEEYETLCNVTAPDVHADEVNPTEKATNITYEMYKDKKTFQNSEKFSRLSEMLLSDDYIEVAHNASFEHSWFSFNIPGYFEKKHTSQKDTSKHSTSLDTRFQSKILDENRKNTLEAFATEYGIAYEGAHRALNDTTFMRKAFFMSREANANK